MAKQPDPKIEATPEKPKEPVLFPATASGMDDNGLRWEDLNVLGVPYRVREISVTESDDAFDKSENPDKTFNPRFQQRLELVASIESPKTTIDDIEKWSVRKLRALLYVSARINSLPAADEAGNA